jgi:hypothetical protein
VKVFHLTTLPMVGQSEADYLTGRLDDGKLRLDVWCERRNALSGAATSAGTRRLHGDHTRPACRRRRLGDDLLAHTLESLKGDRKSERWKCSASRRARHVSGVRSRLVCMGTTRGPRVVGAGSATTSWLTL